MQITDLIQGSAEWHAHRANHFNASDAPAMLGESKYTTRDQLLHEKATGITKEVDAKTQKAFDDGHRFEALARPIAEKIIGMELYPVTGTNGKYSASFDGITMDETIIMEHKSLNDELRVAFDPIDAVTEIELPLMYAIQMEHQLMVSGAEKCLFMASKWNGEALVEERHTWYYPNLELRQRIIDGWAQFEIDLANYVPPVQVEKVVAETVEALPVPSVVVRGEITASNLNEITPKFDAYLGSIKTTLSTDQDFADAEANAKNCEDTEKRIQALRENIIAQMVTVNEVDSVLANYQEAFKKLKVLLKNAVKEQKDTIKTNAILKAKQEYEQHVTALNIQGITLHLEYPNFAEAIKNVKSIASMQSRLNDAVANGKAQANQLAHEVIGKLLYIKEAIKGYEHLFDVNELAFKDIEFISLSIQSAIDKENARRAEYEAQIKAQAEAEARAKLEAEQRAKELAEAQQPVNEAKPQLSQSESAPNTQDQVAQNASSLAQLPKAMEAEFGKVFQPDAHEIVQIVARAKQVDEQLAHKWLCSTNFNEYKKVA